MGHRETQCTVCLHRERAAIDLALARNVSVTAIGRRYQLSTDSLYRHAKSHLTPALRARLVAGPSVEGVDLDKLHETESQSLLMNLVALRNRLFASLDTAEECGDGSMLARIAGQLHHNLEITARLVGSLASGTTTINNVLVMPQYVHLRIELVKAFPYAEARQAVAQVLHQLESKAAADIAADTRELAK
jgi:hypothetical protein